MSSTPPTPRQVYKDVRAFIRQLESLVEFREELDKGWTADSLVKAAEQRLADVEGRISAAEGRATSAEANAASREQAAAGHAAKAERDADEAVARFAAHQEVEIAKVTNAAAARIAASSAKAEAAEKAASDAESRLQQLNSAIDAASTRRASLLGDVESLRKALG